LVPEFAVTAIGRDRPGIVAAISRALLGLEGNIEDSRMAILGGHFAVMLLVRVPDSVSQAELSDTLGKVRDELGLEAITMNPVDELDAAPPAATHVLTVYGADHPGIVHAISGALADLGVNIADLQTRVAGSRERPVYVMMLEVALGEADPEGVDAALRDVGERERVEISLRPLGAEAL
jgi:glycine cleavage system transcriptional repressor